MEADHDPGEIRATLTRLWGDVCEEVGDGRSTRAVDPDVDFVAAGGSSILAVLLLSRIYDELGVDIAFPELMEEPTISGLSRRVIDAVLAEPVSDETGRPRSEADVSGAA